jgi:DNA polymerase-3 subunit gamma/tau
MIELLAGAMEAIRAGADSRTQLELAVVKAAAPEVDSSTQALLARIERLEGELSIAGTGSPPPRPPNVPTRSPAPPAQPSQPTAAPTPEEPVREQPAKAPEPPASEPVLDGPPPESPPADAPVPVNTAVEVAPAPRDLQSVSALWPAVIDLIRSENALVGALLAEASPVALDGEDLILAFAASDAFLKKKAEDPNNRALVTTALQQLAGLRLRISYELREELSKREDRRSAPPSAEDLVSRLMAEFDAEELPRDPAM